MAAKKAGGTKPANTENLHDASQDDDRAHVANRVFELNYATTNEDHEGVVYRMRFKIGGIEDNVVFLGAGQDYPVYTGLVSKKISAQKWTAYGWGHLPASADCAREIFETELQKPAKKDEGATPAAE